VVKEVKTDQSSLARIPEIVKRAVAKGKQKPFHPTAEKKYKHALTKGSRDEPEMPGRLGWSLVGGGGYGETEILHGEMNHHFWRIALVVAAKILANPEALKIESIEDLEKREQELQEMLADDQKKAGLQVIVRPIVSFTLKYVQDVLGFKHLREKEVAAMLEEFAGVRLKVTQFKGLRLQRKNGSTTWEKITTESGDIASVVHDLTTDKGKRGRGAGTKQVRFTLAFYSRIGLAFYHDLCTGGATLLQGATKLLRTSESYQRLIFNLCTTQAPARIHREKLLALVGMPKSENQDYYYHQLSILRGLIQQGIEDGYFKSFSELDGGTWEIKKPGSYPLLPADAPSAD